MDKRMWIKGSVALSLGLCLGTAAWAASTPATLSGVKIISAEEAKKMQDGGTPMFDNRVAAEYAEKTVKGARSLVYKEKSEKSADFDASKDSLDLSKLPSDKAAAFIFFCNGGECWRSYKASVVAQKAGYTQVHWMRGGLPEWTSKGLPTQ